MNNTNENGQVQNGRTQFAPTSTSENHPRPIRKPNRLRDYDYSQAGAYFITVCAQNRAELFGHIAAVGANCVRPFTELSNLGQIIKNEIETLSHTYPIVHLDGYVIMPNHVHMIVVIDDVAECTTVNNPLRRGELRSPVLPTTPTMSRIIKQWKGAITKRIGFSPWQKSFHDHVIRNTDDYLRIAEYMENNPAQWEQDCLYPAPNTLTTRSKP